MRKRDNIVELIKTESSEEGLVRYFKWNDKEYSVVNGPVYQDDVRVVLNGILTQAVNDYIKLYPGTNLKEEDAQYYQSAKSLLFNDDYLIDFGDIDIGIRDIIFFITGSEPNMEMFRAGVIGKLYDSQNKKPIIRANKNTESDEE